MTVIRSIRKFDNLDTGIKVKVSFQELLSDPTLNNILIKIGGRDYLVEILDIISFNKDFNELSDDLISEHLEKMAAWQFTIISAKSELEVELKTKKLEFNLWKNNIYRSFEKKDFESKLTDKKLDRLLIENHEVLFKEKQLEIYELESLDSQIYHIFEILKQRNETLRSILRRRDFKQGKASGSGY